MAAGFAVTISARDDISKSLAKINSGLQQLGQVARGVNAEAEKGADRGGTSFRRMGEHATEAGKGIVEVFTRAKRAAVSTTRRLGEMLTPLRGLAAIASVGGLAALMDNWATAGAGIARTAVSVGTTVRELQRLQGAGQFAGIATDTMSQSIGGLNRSIHDAAYGLGGSGGLIFYAQRYNIALRNSDGSIRSTTEVMHDLADATARLRDPDSQHRLLQAFGVDDLFSLMRQGSAAMRQLEDETIIPKIENAEELHRSYVRLGQAGAAAGYLIATHLEPYVKRLADWMAQPANQQWFGDKVEHFFQAIENFDYSKLERLIDKLGALGKMLGLGGEEGSTPGGLGSVTAGIAPGALAGAFAGRWFGPFGAILGAVIGGGIGGATGGSPANEEYNKALRKKTLGGPVGQLGANSDRTLDLIKEHESRGRNIRNEQGSDASGLYQITKGTWGDFAPGAGVDLKQYPEAIDAPEDVQRRVARAILESPKGGLDRWSTAAKVRADLAKGSQSAPAGRPWYQRLLGGLNPISTAGAYGVPGAVMNYGGTGAMGAAGSNLVTISTASGRRFTVNRAAAPAFQGFVDDLEATGYKINSIGGYSNRGKRGGSGLSEHAYGAAIDINPGANAFQSAGGDMPANIHDIAAKRGLVWGGDWKKPARPHALPVGRPRCRRRADAAGGRWR